MIGSDEIVVVAQALDVNSPDVRRDHLLVHYLGDAVMPLHLMTDYKGVAYGTPATESGSTNVHKYYDRMLFERSPDEFTEQVPKALKSFKPIPSVELANGRDVARYVLEVMHRAWVARRTRDGLNETGSADNARGHVARSLVSTKQSTARDARVSQKAYIEPAWKVRSQFAFLRRCSKSWTGVQSVGGVRVLT